MTYTPASEILDSVFFLNPQHRVRVKAKKLFPWLAQLQSP